MQRRTKKRKLKKGRVIGSFIILLAFIGLCVFAVSKLKPQVTKQRAESSQTSSSSSTAESKTTDLPEAHRSDWNLVLVNRENPKEELSPELTTVGNVQVDQRIADSLVKFWAAAQAIDPAEHLISAYRSVAYQEQLFNTYGEMKGLALQDPSIIQGNPYLVSKRKRMLKLIHNLRVAQSTKQA